ITGCSYGQCVRESLKTNSFRGQVFDVHGKNKEVISDAEVQLQTQTRKQRRIVVRLRTDANGMFSAPKVSAGNYFLDVHSPHFSRIVTEIKIVKPSKGANIDSLLIRLDVPGPG